MNALPNRKPIDQATISIVLPVYNEVAVLRELHRQVSDSLNAIPSDVEFIFVNDGSCDGSSDLLDELAIEDSARTRVAFIPQLRSSGSATGWLKAMPLAMQSSSWIRTCKTLRVALLISFASGKTGSMSFMPFAKNAKKVL